MTRKRLHSEEIARFFAANNLPADLAARLSASLAVGDPERPAEGAPTVAFTSVIPDPVYAATQPAAPDRYEALGVLGKGGMGEVRRVLDRELGRTCAYKVMRPEFAAKPAAVQRFVEEARVAAQLQHPNIAPVYDAGRMPDGRPWFTMKEVRGRTLSDLVLDLHAPPGPTSAGIRRLCHVFAKVCDGVGYAHARGVVHRDLKPDNLMTGPHGEVLVLDWGLAKVLGEPSSVDVDPDDEGPLVSARTAGRSPKTRAGGVLGTRGYMAPEQAQGAIHRLDARSDVFALGAILYEILSGQIPGEGLDPRAVLESAGRPADLVALCAACMSPEPGDRPPDGAAVAREVRTWLDGARREAQALAIVGSADRANEQAARLRDRAARLRAEGAALLANVPAWAPEAEKIAGWTLRDEATRADHAAGLLELRRELLLYGALTHAPDLPDAHAALVALELARHQLAEHARDTAAADRAEVRLREHAVALPEAHPVQRQAAVYLRGTGALSLSTDAPGALVDLYRFETQNRRLIAVPVRSLGPTPLIEVPLPMGSYLCVVRHPGRIEVRYPVLLERGRQWDGVAPGETAPLPIRLPAADACGADDCYVPAGWFWSGGDPEAVDSLPRRRLWCDGLVVKRFPVTNREYIAFLDDLVATGREADALRHAPRERSITFGALVYGRSASGGFTLRPDADGDVWEPDFPVFLIDWDAARAYAAWLADRTHRPWRLLGELEREKAARGVDGRFFPWGDAFDPTWCRMRESLPGRAMPAVVDSHPVDCSVYGIRGLAGNANDWCGDPFRREGPALAGDRVPPAAAGEPEATRTIRGGYWAGAARGARAATRSLLRASTDNWGSGSGSACPADPSLRGACGCSRATPLGFRNRGVAQRAGVRRPPWVSQPRRCATARDPATPLGFATAALRNGRGSGDPLGFRNPAGSGDPHRRAGGSRPQAKNLPFTRPGAVGSAEPPGRCSRRAGGQVPLCGSGQGAPGCETDRRGSAVGDLDRAPDSGRDPREEGVERRVVGGVASTPAPRDRLDDGVARAAGDRAYIGAQS